MRDELDNRAKRFSVLVEATCVRKETRDETNRGARRGSYENVTVKRRPCAGLTSRCRPGCSTAFWGPTAPERPRP